MTQINLKTNKIKGRNMVYIGIIYAVDMHRKATQLVLNNACTYNTGRPTENKTGVFFYI